MSAQLIRRAGWKLEIEVVEGLDLAGDIANPGAPPTVNNTLAGSLLISNTIVGFAALAGTRDARKLAIRNRIAALEAAL